MKDQSAVVADAAAPTSIAAAHPFAWRELDASPTRDRIECSDETMGGAACVVVGRTSISSAAASELRTGSCLQLDAHVRTPAELHYEGKLIGHVEIVEVDGKLALRICDLNDQFQAIVNKAADARVQV